MQEITSLVSVIHSEAGVGKSTLLDTAPSPRLLIDTEGKSKYFRDRVYWDPAIEEPPEADRVIVLAQDYDVFSLVYDQLVVKNPFESCNVDSIWNAQKKLIVEEAGLEAPDKRQWGAIKRRMEALVANYMLLNFQTLTFSCGSIMKDDLVRPMLDGGIIQTLSHLVDVIGYLGVQIDKEGNLQRKLLTQPLPPYLAKDNTGAFPGPWIDEPNLTEMSAIYQKHIGNNQ